MGVNPDQRMNEDALKLCDLSVGLGVGLLRRVLFVQLRGRAVGHLQGLQHLRRRPGLCRAGLHAVGRDFYAVVGSLLSYWVGNSLISRNAERYAREGELRFSLVRINEHLDGISLAGGEADEQRRVDMHLGNVLHATSRVVLGLTNLTWVTAGFGWITVIAPTWWPRRCISRGRFRSAA